MNIVEGFDTGSVSHPGFGLPAGELAAAANVGTDAAQRQLAEAWTLTQKCQPTLLALSDGEISFAHAVVIARELADRHAHAYERRNVSVNGAGDGMAALTAYIDAGDAAVIRTGLANAAREARQAGDSRHRPQGTSPRTTTT